jgi:hypothetical protein
MNERGGPMNDDAFKVGLLMESAQTHQKMVEENLERLRAHTRDLDTVVRDEIRRTLLAELQEVAVESKRAARALQGMRHAISLRAALWSIGIAVLSAVIPCAIVWRVTPSAAEISALRQTRDQLTANLARLEQRGGRVDLRHCGDSSRLCVRVERKAPAYGPQAEYLIVKGY